jgi:hypothetical protein
LQCTYCYVAVIHLWNVLVLQCLNDCVASVLQCSYCYVAVIHLWNVLVLQCLYDCVASVLQCPYPNLRSPNMLQTLYDSVAVLVSFCCSANNNYISVWSDLKKNSALEILYCTTTNVFLSLRHGVCAYAYVCMYVWDSALWSCAFVSRCLCKWLSALFQCRFSFVGFVIEWDNVCANLYDEIKSGEELQSELLRFAVWSWKRLMPVCTCSLCAYANAFL